MVKSNINEDSISFEEFKKEILGDYKIATISRFINLIVKEKNLLGNTIDISNHIGNELIFVTMSKIIGEGDFVYNQIFNNSMLLANQNLNVDEIINLYKNRDEINRSKFNQSVDIDVSRLLGLALSVKGDNHSGNVFTAINNNSNIGDNIKVYIEKVKELQLPVMMTLLNTIDEDLLKTSDDKNDILSYINSENRNDEFIILSAKAWDYAGLISMYKQAKFMSETENKPVIFNIDEVACYKDCVIVDTEKTYNQKERFEWEKDIDPLIKMKKWIVDMNIASENELNEIEAEARNKIENIKEDLILDPIIEEKKLANSLFNNWKQLSEINADIKLLTSSELDVSLGAYIGNSILKFNSSDDFLINTALGLSLNNSFPIVEINNIGEFEMSLCKYSKELSEIIENKRIIFSVKDNSERHSLLEIISLSNGMDLFIARNEIQASAIYNSLISSNRSGIVIEQNGDMSSNIDMSNLMIIPGVPDVIKSGSDVTIVSYGKCIDIINQALESFKEVELDCEVIDVCSLMPLDVDDVIKRSLRKTKKVLFVEDVKHFGTASFISQSIIETKQAFYTLDKVPTTISIEINKDGVSKVVENVFGLAH